MVLIQMTGLSGAGKTTLAEGAVAGLNQYGYRAEVMDGDVYRRTVCKDLGFSREDRLENVRRLGEIGWKKVKENTIVILSVINPYKEGRRRLCAECGAGAEYGAGAVKLVWIDCELSILEKRDTKGLYQRAKLPVGHPDRIGNLSGVNDPFEIPDQYDLRIDTGVEDIAGCVRKLTEFILGVIPRSADDPLQLPPLVKVVQV